jgi:hypothetical protein
MHGSPDHTPHAVVSCGSRRWSLSPGDTLTFGRGAGHPLRLGHSPEDLRVPRFAGKFECREDGVLVHNMSDKRTLVVQAFPGPGYDVLPLMIAGTHPHPQVKVVITGGAGTYAIVVDTRPLGPRTAPADRGIAYRGGGTAGFDRIESMSRRHRLLLSALCLPMLTRSGPRAEVPTYAEMEKILGDQGHSFKAKTIRNGLDELRGRLTYEHGVDGLLGESSGDVSGPPGGFVAALARWAVLSGNVTDRDLERMEAGEDDSEPSSADG